MAILLVVLVLMNTYPLMVSEDLVFRAKRTALQSGASAINVAVSGLEELTEENVAVAMEGVETDGVSRAAGGTGLGLSIVRDTVSRRGGDIWAENIPEGGTRFIVKLPCLEREEAET